MNKYSRYNQVTPGLIAGLVLPVITMAIIYFVRFQDLSLKGFLNHLISVHLLSSLISLCVIPNLLLFFVAIWLNRLFVARGVLMATFIFALIVVIAKYAF